MEIARKEQNARLSSRGLRVKPIKSDGNCLFRAIADQLFNDENRHFEVRAKCVERIAANRSLYKGFVAGGDVDGRIRRMRCDGEWGDHIELHALAEAFAVQIEVYLRKSPIVVYRPQSAAVSRARLFYNSMAHYDSVVCVGAPPNELETFETPKTVFCGEKMEENFGLNLREIIERSLENDFLRQSEAAIAESERTQIESEIIRRVERETAIDAPFDLFAELLEMGYTSEIALECVLNFGANENDIEKVVNFIVLSKSLK